MYGCYICLSILNSYIQLDTILSRINQECTPQYTVHCAVQNASVFRIPTHHFTVSIDIVTAPVVVSGGQNAGPVLNPTFLVVHNHLPRIFRLPAFSFSLHYLVWSIKTTSHYDFIRHLNGTCIPEKNMELGTVFFNAKFFTMCHISVESGL